MKLKLLFIGLVLLMFVPIANAALTDGIIGSWNVTDGSGNDIIKNIGASNAHLKGTATWVTNYDGLATHAVSVLGSGTSGDSTRSLSANMSVSVNTTQDITACFWANLPATYTGAGYHIAQIQPVGSANSDLEIQASSGTQVKMYTSSSAGVGSTGATAVTLGTGWNFYCVGRSNSATQLFLYRNATLLVNDTVTARDWGASGANSISFPEGQGSYGTAGTYYVSNVNVWSRALTTAEITTLFDTSSNGYYPFSTPPVISDNVTITATDVYTGASILNLSVSAINASGYQYNSTTYAGTISQWDAPFYANSTSLWNITITVPTTNYTNISATFTNPTYANDMNWNTYPTLSRYGFSTGIAYYYWSYNNTLGAISKTWIVSDYNVTTASQVNTTLTLPANASSYGNIQLRSYISYNSLSNTHLWQYYDGYNWVTLRSNTENLGFGEMPRIYEQLLVNETQTYNTYFPRTLINQNVSSAVSTTLAQSIITFSGTELYSGATISGMNFTTTYLTNITHYMKTGTYDVTASKAGYYSQSEQFTITPLEISSLTIANLTNTRLNLTFKNAVNLSSILVYDATITSLDNPLYTQTLSTTNGTIIFDALVGNWSVFINSSDYAYTYYNVTMVAGMNNLTGFAYASRSFSFTVYDEITGQIIQPMPVTIELIGTYNSYNITTINGTWYKELITPDNYLVRYSAADYAQRFSYVTITERSSVNVSLYLLNTSLGTNITITLYEQNRALVINALIKVLKYDIVSNAYTVTDTIFTNNDGQAYFDAQTDIEYYKFIVQYPAGTVVLTTDPSYIHSTDITLQFVSAISGTAIFDTLFDISSSLTFNTATNNFRFEYTDNSNSVERACVYVYQISTSNAIYNSSCVDAATGTILVAVNNITGTVYQADTYYTISGQQYYVSTAIADFRDTNDFGSLGMLIVIFLTMGIVLIFRESPKIAILGAPIPLLFASIAGFVSVPFWIPVSLLALAAVIIVTISRWS